MARIYIIDDDPIWTTEGKRVLERSNHDVYTRSDLRSGLSTLQYDVPDLVITDKNLGERYGVIPLLDYLHEERPNTKVVVWSGEDNVQARKVLRADAFIDKTKVFLDGDGLTPVIKRLLAA